MGAIDFLSQSAMAEPRADSEILAQKLTLGETISAALAVDGHDPSAAYPSKPSPAIDVQSIPLDKETTWEYMKDFLDLCAVTPCLDREAFSHQYANVVTNCRQNNGDIPPLHRFNVNMGIAIGVFMSNSSRLEPWAAALHSSSTDLLPTILRYGRPLESLYCLYLLIIYSLFSPSGGSAWHIVGLAIRLCITMGLHKQASAHAGLTAHEVNERRWLFWSIYILDRSVIRLLLR